MPVLQTPRGTRIVPLGGAGEFGANATIIQSERTTILVDFGIMFPPDQRQPGVDFYINDPQLLLDQFPNLSAVFITHAHEDHIGALPFLLEKIQVPVYTMPYTAKRFLIGGGFFKGFEPDIRMVELNQAVEHGDLRVEFVGVTHSIVQACALAIDTPDGRILHSGDFKVDPLPGDGYPFQSERLRLLGDEGVDLLIMDSTNATKNGFCPSDFEMIPDLEKIIAGAAGRVFFTTFSSHMPRLKKLLAIAAELGRKICLLGRGFHKHYLTSLDTGYLTDSEVFVSRDKAANLPDERLIYVATGSQGENQSALVKITKGELGGLELRAGDTVIFSSKTIPGNERQIALLASEMERQGVAVFTSRQAMIHTSGHGFREDLAYMLCLTRPRNVAPIHGEFHQLTHHFQWLQSLIGADQQVLLIEDGDSLLLSRGNISRGEIVDTRLLPVDGNQNLPLSKKILKDRKNMMYSGLILIAATVSDNPPGSRFQVATRGLAEAEEGLLAQAVCLDLQHLDLDLIPSAEERVSLIRQQARKSLKKNFFGRPLIQIVLNGEIVS